MLISVATNQAVSTAPEAETFIVLEGRRGEQAVSITVRYDAIQELRSFVKNPQEVASGLLTGSLAAEAIVIEHCSAAGANPIGIFRTQPAGWPAITEPDCKRLRTAVPNARLALLLVVRTLVRRPWSAALFLCDPSHPDTAEPSLLEFPFDEYLLRHGWLTDLAPPPAPPQHLSGRGRARRRGPWLAILAATLIAAGAAAWQYRRIPWLHRADVAPVAAPRVLGPQRL